LYCSEVLWHVMKRTTCSKRRHFKQVYNKHGGHGHMELASINLRPCHPKLIVENIKNYSRNYLFLWRTKSGKKVTMTSPRSTSRKKKNDNWFLFLRCGIWVSLSHNSMLNTMPYGDPPSSTSLYQLGPNSSIPNHTEIFSHLVTALSIHGRVVRNCPL
jgi:hypothetical protein